MRAPTSADLQSGRIIVRASLANLLICRQIPGCSWDRTRKAWSYPGTEITARIVRAKIRPLLASEQFDSAFPVGGPVIKTEPTSAAVVGRDRPCASGGNRDRFAGRACSRGPGGTRRPAYQFASISSPPACAASCWPWAWAPARRLVACMCVLGLRARRVLIACPLRVVPVWITQFERHVGIHVVWPRSTRTPARSAKKQELAEEKMRLAQARGVPFVAVINYDCAWRDPFASWAEKDQWDLVIADEAHRIKAPGGKASPVLQAAAPALRLPGRAHRHADAARPDGHLRRVPVPGHHDLRAVVQRRSGKRTP